jgi:solute carrier family 8 (sodium/calcium exchanger)
MVAANQQNELGSSSWKDQFSDALKVCGGDDDEPDGKPGTMDYVMHALTLPWKLLFATVAPTGYCGGWLCFIWALAYIGVVTALIGDLAGLFGCALGLEDAVTAITFVALGTSLPDTFASKAATLSDDTADAAIGNVTGSNSVNVFLGLGLPWMMASIYWSMKEDDWPADSTAANALADGDPMREWFNKYGGTVKGVTGSLSADYPKGGFIVVAGDLGFSVTVFTCCSLACMITLAIRRKKLGAELGGDPKYNKITSIFFICLWLIYVVFSSLKVYGDI